MTFDDNLDIPPLRPEPPQPVRTVCVGGPWNGANITHMADDHKERSVKAYGGGIAGEYVYTPAVPGNALYATDSWRWTPRL